MKAEFISFDVRVAPLHGINLVEASAGTGKTWNIEGLFIRLLIERHLEPGQILVVTFTDAATQELRERILQRINAVARIIENSDIDVGGDPFLQFCREKYGKNKDIIGHLDYCKSRFDEAAIFTIHSFCKNVLSDYRFEAGLGSEINILSDSELLLREVLSDHWRHLNKRLSVPGNELFSSLLLDELKFSKIESAFKKLLINSEIELSSVEPKVPECWGGLSNWQRERNLIDRCMQLRSMWETEVENLRDQLQSAGISGRGFEKNWDKYEHAVNEFLREPFLNIKIQHHEVLSRDYLVKKGQTKDALKAGKQFPDHIFYSRYQEFIDCVNWYRKYIIRNSLNELKVEYARRRKQDQILIYDDLLTFVRDALDPVRNTNTARFLRDKLRSQYPVAMIDEFQDTDAVQYDIFRRMYVDDPTSELLLYMIGDPKQSIYKFRGADLNTYYRARDKVTNRYTLKTNFRSAGDLVQAVNVLFQHEGSFLDESLKYFDSDGFQSENGFWSELEDAAPLRFLQIGEDVSTKSGSGTALVRSVVHKISELLTGSVRGKVGIRKKNLNGEYQDEKVSPGDIAILVSKKIQAKVIKSMLNQAGIPSVESGDSSVFNSDEAKQLTLLLECLIDSKNKRKLRALLTSPIGGYSVNDIIELEQNDLKWSFVLEELRQAGDLMKQHGVLSGIRYLFDQWGAEQRIVALENGERSITNLRHLGELMYAEEQETHRSASGLIHWLKRHRSDDDKKDDGRKIRLESDDDRVQIITMHSSKGLEYPIVFAPYLWDFNTNSNDKWNIFTVDDNDDKHLVMDHDNDVYDTGSILSRLEDWQDRIRLMYVAVTRAKYRCYIPFQGYNGNYGSPLCGVLLSRYMKGEWGLHWNDRMKWVSDGNNLASRFGDEGSITKDNLMLALIPRLVEESGGLISHNLVSFDEIPRTFIRFKEIHDMTDLKEMKIGATGRKRLFKNRYISSYSSIQRKYTGEDVEYDFSDESVMEEVSTDQPISDEFSEIFEFPKGAVTGNLWHEVFELIDFSDPTHWEDTFKMCSLKHGFEPDTTVPLLRDMVNQVLPTDLSAVISSAGFDGHNNIDAMRLQSIQWHETRREMEFLSTFDPDDINKMISILSQQKDQGELNIFGKANIEATSLLVGLIDLIFVHNGKYYIVDYKSNYLGSDLTDYDFNRLKKDIRENKYDLQYHIYTVALVKYLSKQIKDFDYDEHFGGVFYLYVRGMRRESVTGLFYDKPEKQIIMKLLGHHDTNLIQDRSISGGHHD